MMIHKFTSNDLSPYTGDHTLLSGYVLVNITRHYLPYHIVVLIKNERSIPKFNYM